jgi:anti-anti-sigma factor
MSLTDRRPGQTYPTGSKSAGFPHPALFSVDLLVLEDETILTLHGVLDSWMQRELTTALDSVGLDVPRLVLDLSDLTFIDVASIGILHQRRAVLEAHGGSLQLRSPSRQLRRILEITGMIGDISSDPIQHRFVLPLPSLAYERGPAQGT